jgi:hypothetical protein
MGKRFKNLHRVIKKGLSGNFQKLLRGVTTKTGARTPGYDNGISFHLP